MTTETLQRMIRATPFEPFSLHLADGDVLDVLDSELIAHYPGNHVAFVVFPNEDFRLINLPDVVSIGRPTEAAKR